MEPNTTVYGTASERLCSRMQKGAAQVWWSGPSVGGVSAAGTHLPSWCEGAQRNSWKGVHYRLRRGTPRWGKGEAPDDVTLRPG